MNPLLTDLPLPAFESIDAKHVETAIDYILEENQLRLCQLLQQSRFTWDNLIVPIDQLEHRLARVWSSVRHLNSVRGSDELRDAYNRCLPKLTDYATAMAHNQALYEAYRAIEASPEHRVATRAQRRVLELALRDFHLMGIDLNEDAKNRFKTINARLSEITAQFSDNVIDATQSWALSVAPETLGSVPETVIALLEQMGRSRDHEGLIITLDFPVYQAVMTHVENRSLRETVYRAFVTRASEHFDDPKWDNRPLIEEIMALRHELARLLGFANYAAYSLARKMAEESSQVFDFINNLNEKARPAASQEKAELEQFARTCLGYDCALEPWDISFVTEKLKQSRFNLSQEALKPYFPVERVLEGVFDLLNKLFGLKITRNDDAETWHPDVRFYDVQDQTGALRGQFFLDLYARPRKRGGAWMDVCVGRMRTENVLVTPVAYLTCNATPPLEGTPALLTHDEVTTLLHEFGHVLHHLLTQIDHPGIAGINGVEWDAVELPSQWMENWCWHRAGLDLLSGHFETGEPLPESMLESIRAVKQFQAGMQIVRQLEFALFDFRMHHEFDPNKGSRLEDILDAVRAEVAVIIPPRYNRFANAFTHIFSGGYAAGYYSYKWAEVLSADAFAIFVETGYFEPGVGQSFLREILETGALRPAMEHYLAFAGRPPEISALLSDVGIH
ncbi:MAG: M3 family metallopeptidase [Thiotrichales bacterium]